MTSKSILTVGNKTYHYYALQSLGDLTSLPFSLKVLLENLLRHFDGQRVKKEDLKNIINSTKNTGASKEISFSPARVLMQDFTGVPAIVDLAAMRDAMQKNGGDAKKINPLIPVDLVIDHSVMVDQFASKEAFGKNVTIEYQRNLERYTFLKWG